MVSVQVDSVARKRRAGNRRRLVPYAQVVMKYRLSIVLVWGLTWTVAFGLVAHAAAQRQEPLFELGRDKIVRVVVTTTIELPELPDVPPRRELPRMALEASGVLEIIEGRRLRDVRALAPRSAKPIGRPPDAKSVCFMHLIGSTTTKTIEIVATDDGLVVGEHAGTGLDRPSRAELNRVRWERFSKGWSIYRGGFNPTEDQVATTFEMPTPYKHGSVTFDFETIDNRFYFGVRLRETYKLDRVMNEDPINVRLPRGYDPNRPAGLLVWISPSRDGTIPSQFRQALDELNLIAIGANNSGNHRLTNSRYQLAFDGIATASNRYHVDPDRIYVTGMSGGGRVSSMLGMCFPDVFAGTIPIVGMSIYEITNRGDGKKWQRGFYKPPSKLFRILRTHRFAPMGGPPDFNYAEMQAAMRVLQRDRVPSRFFEYEDMAHEMPKPDRFADAMQWVDEPYRDAENERLAKAQQKLDEYARRFGQGTNAPDDGNGVRTAAGDPDSPEAIGLLLDVIEAAPWSPPAWSALELLLK